MPAERLARGGAISLAGSAFSALAALALTVLLGHALGPSGTGVFYRAMGIFAVLTQILRLGTHTGIVRFVAEQRAFHHPGQEWRIIAMAALPVAVVSGGGAFLVWLFATPVSRWLSGPDEASLMAALLRTMAPFLAVAAIQGVIESSARMLRGVAAFTLLQSILLPAGRLVTVAVAAATGATAWLTFEAWLIPLPVLAGVGLLLIASPYLDSMRHRRDTPASQRVTTSGFWRFTLPRSVSAALEIGLEWADVIIVAALASAETAGIYAVVTRVIKAGGVVDQAMRVAVSPTISAMLARRETAAVSALHTRVVKAMILLSWPFYVTTISMGGAVLALFGDGFSAGWGPMAPLALALMLQLSAGMLQSILIQGGRSTWQMYNKTIALALSVAGNITLVPVWGVWGASVTWFVVALVDNGIAAYQVHRLMGVHLHPRHLVPAMIPPALVFGAGGIGVTALWGTSPGSLIAIMPLGFAYLGLLWALRRRLGIVDLWSRVPFIGRLA